MTFESLLRPAIDFLVFGFIVIGGACGLTLISLMEEFAVAARAALSCWVRYLLPLGLEELVGMTGPFDTGL